MDDLESLLERGRIYAAAVSSLNKLKQERPWDKDRIEIAEICVQAADNMIKKHPMVC